MNAGKPFLPFALPEIGQEEIDEVVDSLRSGWITTGPKTRLFEQSFADYLGGGVQAVAVNSATAGLHLAVEALGIRPGDEVVTTTHTFTATAEVVRYLGAHPVFVDIDLAHLLPRRRLGCGGDRACHSGRAARAFCWTPVQHGKAHGNLPTRPASRWSRTRRTRSPPDPTGD